MTRYIGTKMLDAEPMTRGEYNKFRGWKLPKDENGDDPGYRVVYSDNYVSWCPRKQFEDAYISLKVNADLKTDAPSISAEMVDAFIVSTKVQTLGHKCTVVRAILANGFEIVESSACVSAENYDEKLGADICMEKIKDKVWFLLGFLLQTAVHGVKA